MIATGRWVTLELIHDGNRVSLVVDGRQEGSAAAVGAPYRRPQDEFVISPSSAPIVGTIDEVQLLAFERGEEQTMPFGVDWVGVPGPIRFDRRGQVVEPKPALVGVELTDEKVVRTIGPGGVLQ